ncbi:MAG TPA: glutaredoxin family protein [Rubrivivax sp.]|nr:glutaredoxin family protein [Rubrivivax sp.]
MRLSADPPMAMPHTDRPFLPFRCRRRQRALALAALAAGCLALPAAAQYKVVGPDGRITYTDRPPTDGSARVSTLGREAAAPPAPQDALPQELRQLAQRFPVTLYSSADCTPCDAGRQLLLQRGVPFTEKLVASNDDAAALERLSGARTVPALTVGAQVLRGLSHDEWASYLDLAGYPRESRLPRGWQAAPATPLAARAAPAPAAPPDAPARRPAAATPEAPPPAPGGIRF